MANGIVPGAATATSLFGGYNQALAAGAGRQAAPAVPSGPSASPSTSVSQDVESLWSKMQTNVVDPGTYQRALTPMVTGHDLQMPSSMTTPIAPYQERPMNRAPVVGAGNARGRGIANAITGITNAIGAVTTAKAQKDQRAVSTSTQRLLQSQQAIDQATAILNSGQFKPESAEYKNIQASIQKNTQVRDDILSDDKTRKAVEKGFNISFTDPSKNKTLEHGGVQDGIKSFGEQFASKMPQQIGPNVLAQQQLQMQMQQQKLNQESTKNFMTYALAARKLDQQWNITNFKEGQQNARVQAQLDQRWDMQTRDFNFRAKAMSARFEHDFDKISYASRVALNAQKDLFNFKTDSEAFQKWQTSDIALGKAIESANDGIRKVENDMQLNAGAIKNDPNLAKDYNDQLTSLKNQRDLFTSQQSANRNIMRSLSPDLVPEEAQAEAATNPMNQPETFLQEQSLEAVDEASGGSHELFTY